MIIDQGPRAIFGYAGSPSSEPTDADVPDRLPAGTSWLIDYGDRLVSSRVIARLDDDPTCVVVRCTLVAGPAWPSPLGPTYIRELPPQLEYMLVGVLRSMRRSDGASVLVEMEVARG